MLAPFIPFFDQEFEKKGFPFSKREIPPFGSIGYFAVSILELIFMQRGTLMLFALLDRIVSPMEVNVFLSLKRGLFRGVVGKGILLGVCKSVHSLVGRRLFFDSDYGVILLCRVLTLYCVWILRAPSGVLSLIHI